MRNIEFIERLLLCKSKRDIVRLLNKYRIPVDKSKYC